MSTQKRIILSTAHNKIKKGASYEGVYEWDLSKEITSKVYELLEQKGADVHHIPGGSLTKKKVPAVNRLAKGHDALALEIHFNAAGKTDKKAPRGSCVLYYHNSTSGKKAAKTMLDQLLTLNRGQHWHGIIPIPGVYREVDLIFLSRTTCTALLIEVDSIREHVWASKNTETIAKAIADGILAIV